MSGWNGAWTVNLSSDAIAQVEAALTRGETMAKKCFHVVPKEEWANVHGAVKVSVVADGKRTHHRCYQ
jgi:hypothetical protein